MMKKTLKIILSILFGIIAVFIIANIVLLIHDSRLKTRPPIEEFSFQEAMNSIDPRSFSVKTEGFVNTDEFIVDEFNVYERAKLELKDPGIVVTYLISHDKKADMWCVRFGKKDDDTHYLIWFETVYLTGKGVTVLINSDEYTDYSTKIT